MVPAALGLGDGGEFRSPMAIAVIGGLIVSTLLSLVFVPSFYTIMDDLALATARFFHWAVRPNRPDEPESAPPHHGPVLLPAPGGTHHSLPIAAE
jgi:hypothetical protein